MNSLPFQSTPNPPEAEITSVPCSIASDSRSVTLCDSGSVISAKTEANTKVSVGEYVLPLSSDDLAKKPRPQHRLRTGGIIRHGRERVSTSLQSVAMTIWQFICAIGCVCIMCSIIKQVCSLICRTSLRKRASSCYNSCIHILHDYLGAFIFTCFLLMIAGCVIVVAKRHTDVGLIIMGAGWVGFMGFCVIGCVLHR